MSVDSTETITITGSINKFATENTINGSNYSTDIKKIILAQQESPKEISRLNKQFADKK